MMSPAKLRILLDCYTKVGAYSGLQIPVDDIQSLLNEGMIEPAIAGYTTTRKGEFWIGYILKTPLPVAQFIIPELERQK